MVTSWAMFANKPFSELAECLLTHGCSMMSDYTQCRKQGTTLPLLFTVSPRDYVKQNSAVHHPLETHHASVVDEPQLSYQAR
jgi:hypothetical protein